MANTQAMCSSLKSELMLGLHAFGPNASPIPARTAAVADVVKAALYYATASIDGTTTVYTATGEVANSGSYVATGLPITMANAPSLSGTTAIFTPSASIVYTSFSAGAFDCCLLHNSSQGNRAIIVLTFGSQSVSSGTFTLTMPANDASNALIRIA